jgi:hypothetical protein
MTPENRTGLTVEAYDHNKVRLDEINSNLAKERVAVLNKIKSSGPSEFSLRLLFQLTGLHEEALKATLPFATVSAFEEQYPRSERERRLQTASATWH